MVQSLASIAILASLFLGMTSAAPIAVASSKADESTKRTTLAATPQGLHSGSASYFAQGQSSCGTVNSDTDLVVALSQSYMTGYESSLCGKQVWIKNTGAFDEALPNEGLGQTVIATVGDTCPDGDAASGGCQLDDIDLSPATINQITNGQYETLGRVQVSWGMVGDPAVTDPTATGTTTTDPATSDPATAQP